MKSFSALRADVTRYVWLNRFRPFMSATTLLARWMLAVFAAIREAPLLLIILEIVTAFIRPRLAVGVAAHRPTVP